MKLISNQRQLCLSDLNPAIKRVGRMDYKDFLEMVEQDTILNELLEDAREFEDRLEKFDDLVKKFDDKMTILDKKNPRKKDIYLTIHDSLPPDRRKPDEYYSARLTKEPVTIVEIVHKMEFRGGLGNKVIEPKEMPKEIGGVDVDYIINECRNVVGEKPKPAEKKSRYDLSKVKDPKLREHLLMHEKLDNEYFRGREGWDENV